MSFDRRDIRMMMDVYTLDNVYLGSVLRVAPGNLTGERACAISAPQSSQVSGESMGPAPTWAVGNAGPATQSAAAGYRARTDGAALIGAGDLTVGKWWGLRERRVIPLGLVQTVSLERVVLRVTARQLRGDAN
jgi:hypothetical protein